MSNSFRKLLCNDSRFTNHGVSALFPLAISMGGRRRITLQKKGTSVGDDFQSLPGM